MARTWPRTGWTVVSLTPPSCETEEGTPTSASVSMRPGGSERVAYGAGAEACAVDDGDHVVGVLPGRGEGVKVGDAADGATEAADLVLEVGLRAKDGETVSLLSGKIEVTQAWTYQVAGGLNSE